ncbi:hypothetical protein QTP86_005281, partial [Hemibagrus guttatus]
LHPLAIAVLCTSEEAIFISASQNPGPLSSESDPSELPSSPMPDRDSRVPDIMLADSR